MTGKKRTTYPTGLSGDEYYSRAEYGSGGELLRGSVAGVFNPATGEFNKYQVESDQPFAAGDWKTLAGVEGDPNVTRMVVTSKWENLVKEAKFNQLLYPGEMYRIIKGTDTQGKQDHDSYKTTSGIIKKSNQPFHRVITTRLHGYTGGEEFYMHDMFQDDGDSYSSCIVNWLWYLLAIAKELDRIHDVGVAHGDIKHENFMVQYNEDLQSEGRFKIRFIDFGNTDYIGAHTNKEMDIENFIKKMINMYFMTNLNLRNTLSAALKNLKGQGSLKRFILDLKALLHIQDQSLKHRFPHAVTNIEAQQTVNSILASHIDSDTLPHLALDISQQAILSLSQVTMSATDVSIGDMRSLLNRLWIVEGLGETGLNVFSHLHKRIKLKKAVTASSDEENLIPSTLPSPNNARQLVIWCASQILQNPSLDLSLRIHWCIMLILFCCCWVQTKTHRVPYASTINGKLSFFVNPPGNENVVHYIPPARLSSADDLYQKVLRYIGTSKNRGNHVFVRFLQTLIKIKDPAGSLSMHNLNIAMLLNKFLVIPTR